MQGFIIIVVILDHFPPLQLSCNASNVLKCSEAVGFSEYVRALSISCLLAMVSVDSTSEPLGREAGQWDARFIDVSVQWPFFWVNIYQVVGKC